MSRNHPLDHAQTAALLAELAARGADLTAVRTPWLGATPTMLDREYRHPPLEPLGDTLALAVLAIQRWQAREQEAREQRRR